MVIPNDFYPTSNRAHVSKLKVCLTPSSIVRGPAVPVCFDHLLPTNHQGVIVSSPGRASWTPPVRVRIQRGRKGQLVMTSEGRGSEL